MLMLYLCVCVCIYISSDSERELLWNMKMGNLSDQHALSSATQAQEQVANTYQCLVNDTWKDAMQKSLHTLSIFPSN